MTEFASTTDYQRTLEATLGVPFTRGNRIRVLRNGVEIFPAMLGAIQSARISIELLTFVYWTGDIARQFAEALAERASAGVRVRVILDSVGARSMSEDLQERMKAAGVQLMWFRPVLRWDIWEADNRTHRKVLVCDGRVAFTGGVGIAEEWQGDARDPSEWRDTHFQVEGPAVHGLQAAFIDNWVEADLRVNEHITRIAALDHVGDSAVQVIKTSAAINWSAIATAMHILLAIARTKVRISTAYFVPNDDIIERLKETAQRGVDVQILVPGPHQDMRVTQIAQEDHYAPLLEAGVRMWAFQPSMMHAKIVTVDDTIACVGSANFNQRSMSKDDELAMMIQDREVLRLLDRHFQEDCQRALEVGAPRLRQRGVVRRVKDKVVDAFRREM